MCNESPRKKNMCDHGTGEMAILNSQQGHVNYKFRGKTSYYIEVSELCFLIVKW